MGPRFAQNLFKVWFHALNWRCNILQAPPITNVGDPPSRLVPPTEIDARLGGSPI